MVIAWSRDVDDDLGTHGSRITTPQKTINEAVRVMTLWRRRNAGALVIDEARYGRDGYKWVDVTDVVRQMVMGDRLSMLATQAELGIDDPAEHVVKQLEIKYRLGAEPQKTFRCTEGSEMALP